MNITIKLPLSTGYRVTPGKIQSKVCVRGLAIEICPLLLES